jgi:hypothetical protein
VRVCSDESKIYGSCYNRKVGNHFPHVGRKGFVEGKQEVQKLGDTGQSIKKRIGRHSVVVQSTKPLNSNFVQTQLPLIANPPILQIQNFSLHFLSLISELRDSSL